MALGVYLQPFDMLSGWWFLPLVFDYGCLPVVIIAVAYWMKRVIARPGGRVVTRSENMRVNTVSHQVFFWWKERNKDLVTQIKQGSSTIILAPCGRVGCYRPGRG